jgi:hypothetical protein
MVAPGEDRAVVEIPEITAADDGFHPASDHWWETETAWFSFNVPERRLGGWFYNQVLATQQVCNGGAWVWDDSAAPALYEQNHRDLPIPPVAELDLRDVVLPNGNHIEALEPLTRNRVRYSDPGSLEADLEFRGIMAPNSHPLGAPPVWRGRHFDQPMHVTGEVVLHGEAIAVDCYSTRDRSWGPRPLGPDPRKPPAETPVRVASTKPPKPPEGVGYPFATAGEGESWLLYTRPTLVDGEVSDELSTGYLLRGGRYGHLVSGRRRTRVDPATQWIERIELEAVDEHGRDLAAVGELVARHGPAGTSAGTGLFRWQWDGLEAFGEDQSYAPNDILLRLGSR